MAWAIQKNLHFAVFFGRAKHPAGEKIRKLQFFLKGQASCWERNQRTADFFEVPTGLWERNPRTACLWEGPSTMLEGNPHRAAGSAARRKPAGAHQKNLPVAWVPGYGRSTRGAGKKPVSKNLLVGMDDHLEVPKNPAISKKNLQWGMHDHPEVKKKPAVERS